jgi:hypothetical protein
MAQTIMQQNKQYKRSAHFSDSNIIKRNIFWLANAYKRQEDVFLD